MHDIYEEFPASLQARKWDNSWRWVFWIVGMLK